MRSSRDTRTWALALAVVLLALAGNFARTVHWLVVPHRLCDAHQTIEHGPASALAGTAHEAHEGPRYQSEGRAHEDCPLGVCARVEQALAATPVLVRGAVEVEPRPVPRRTEPNGSIPVLLMAPKHSPPS